jgi:predicted O-methyltransferase YrrM
MSAGTLITRSGKPPAQRAGELRAFLAMLIAANVRTYLEIGARFGDTLAEVAEALPAGATLVVVDMPGGPWGFSDSAATLLEAKAAAERCGHTVHVILGDSRAPETIAQVQAIAPRFDAVFIDGDHAEAGVRADWETYGAMGRLIAFHDVAPNAENTRIEVPKVWRELAALYPCVELRDPSAPGMGIGVLWRGGY